MLHRGDNRTVDLRQKVVVVHNIGATNFLEITIGPDESLKVAPSGERVNRLTRPAQDQTKVEVLRRNQRPDVTNRPLVLVVRGPQQILHPQILNLAEKPIDERVLVVRHVRETN